MVTLAGLYSPHTLRFWCLTWACSAATFVIRVFVAFRTFATAKPSGVAKLFAMRHA